MIRALGMNFLFYHMGGATVVMVGREVYVEMFAIAAVIPLLLYSGGKTINSKAVQWCFYAFYPIHLWALYFVSIY